MVTYSKYLQSNIFIATDEKLIEVKLLKETLTFETATYEYEHNGEVYSAEVGRDSDRFFHLFYASVRDFNDGVSIKPERMHQARVKGIEIDNTEDGLRCYLWVFENNRPIRKYVKVLSLVTTEKAYNTTINLERNDVYGSKEECLAFNKIIADNINGEEIDTNSGYIHQYITFTDEQKKSIEKLRKAIEEVSKTCSFACGYGGLMVFNGKHKISDYDWAHSNEEEYVELYDAGIKLPIIETTYMENPVIVIK